MKNRSLFLLICLIFILPKLTFAENSAIIEFKKNLSGIEASDTTVYIEQLEKIIESAKSQGASIAELVTAALEVGIPLESFMAAAIKHYSVELIVMALITSGSDAAESIKIAILSGGDPAEVEAGAIAAKIAPVEAATMVSVAMNMLLEQEKENEEGKKKKDEEGLGLTPGDATEGGAGGIPGGGGAGPVGGAGGGFASPS